MTRSTNAVTIKYLLFLSFIVIGWFNGKSAALHLPSLPYSDKRFPELKIGLPFFIITDSDENLIFKTNDYTQTKNMMLFLE